MKNFVTYTLAASLAVGAAASHHHNHRHLHAKKDASKVEKRQPDRVTKYVVGATETVYQLAGKILDQDKAKAGLDGGDYVVIGESTPTYSPPPPPPKPTTTSKDLGAQFIESKTTSSPPPPPPPTTTSKPPPPPPKPTHKAPPPVAQAASLSGGSGLDAEFPSGKVKCSEFPSKYGAIPLDWLNQGGWSGLQFVPNFVLGSGVSISNIITGVGGQSCKPNAMCSYACPAGYQKTQWSAEQGATKQSIGGLFCNSEGYLELTRPSHKTLCEAGVGGVYIKNELDVQVCTCRTEYPGTENMVLPAIASAGQTIPLTNPNQNKYYQWGGMATSAQYYVNPKGLAAKDACVWNSPSNPDSAGNWAPINIGVGQAADGITYISVFANAPTSHAKLDFNIEITGDNNSPCGYKNGKYIGGATGCTTGMRPGGKVTIRYY